MPDPNSNEPFEAVAIIGMSGRFPGARNLTEFWRNLRDGIESISFFTPEELESAGVDRDRWNRPDFVRAGGVLEGIEDFDASFFGFNPRDAELLDPQQRIFLECAWHALEDAGYNPDSYSGSIGVYAGSVLSSYLFNILSHQELRAPLENFQTFTGNDKDHLSTRTSYKLNLKGPSITVQTACSTSLVAVSMACQSLLDHQCDMALAGGVAIRVPQGTGYLHQPGMIFSSDGHCRPFDAKADGTLFSNGVGIVVLKRLREAIADRDHIRAIIRGSSINNDGSLKAGYTAPSQDGQAEVIATAQAIAGVHPETISYIETHGTATNLGDPIEIAALTQVFRASTDNKQFCAIGSLKSNIGHMDAAAGVASLIKTVLALENKQLPPSLNFEHPNPAIDFANSPFYVNTSLKEWKSPRTLRRAGVSSFGIGGTNAHVVLEEALPVEASSDSRAIQIVLLSAKSKRALEGATANLAAYLRQHPETHLADVAYTLQNGRKAFSHRRAVLCDTPEDAATALETLDPARVVEASRVQGESSVAFMFPGQGTQRVQMGLDLYRNERVFREQVDFCCQRLLPYLNFDLRDALFPAAVSIEAETRLDQTAVAQPALFVIEYSLARLLMHWGIRPSAMIGHSVGEYVAACLAGVFSLEDALKLLAARGRLMQELPGGSMLAVPLFEDDALGWASEDIQLAAANAPSSCVLSGPTSAIADLQARLASQGVASRLLQTSHAFHSAMMEPMLGPFRKMLEEIKLRPPAIPFVSNVSGTWITGSEATDPAYWARQLRGTVRFASGIRSMLETPNRILLEVGPGSTLTGLAGQQSESSTGQIFLASLPGAAKQEKDAGALLKAVATLWTQGVQINWPAYYADEPRRRLPLPTYPFERQRYWIERRSAAEPAVATTKESSGVRDIADWFYVPVWKQDPWPEVYRASTAPAPTSWLMFTDEGHLASHLAARLRDAGHSVTRVVAGEKFARKADGDYQINPQREKDYIALLQNLRAEGRFPRRIAHLWNIHPARRQTSGEKSSEESHTLGFYSLLSLARALGEQGGKEHVRIDVLSSGLHSITGEEPFCPEKALALGPCLVIPQEYDHLDCRNIDLPDQVWGEAIQDSLLDSLVSELASDRSSMIAYRGGRRWSRSFERVRIGQPRSDQVRLRDAGTYLILGGLGGLGLHLARYLAHAAKKARLVLVARSEIQPKAGWKAWLDTHLIDDPGSAKIRAIQDLEQLGAEVLILSADITDISEMRDAVHAAEQRFGPIHGVVHAAGIAGDGIIQFKTAESTARVLAPKVEGTIVLDALFKDADLDFLIMCSSLSSILGGIGQADYAAANAFMDSYAQGRSSHGGYPVISMNWDAWRDVGMAAEGRQPTTAMNVNQPQQVSGMTPLEGSDAFARILSITGVPQIAVSTIDLNSRMFRRGSPAEPLRAGAASSEESAPVATQPDASPRPAPERRTPYVAPRNAVEQTIAGVWQKLLGIKEVSINDNFFELGGHSLLGTQLISSLRSAFAVELPMRSLFDVPTVEAMAQRIQTIHWALREPDAAAEEQCAEREEGVL